MKKKKQKFHKDDLVHISKDLGPHMSHFEKDLDAIVLGSYNEDCGTGDEDEEGTEYGLFVKGHGKIYWYQENQLTLIKHKQDKLLKKWKIEKSENDAIISNLNWMFENKSKFLKFVSKKTKNTLAREIIRLRKRK